MDRVIVYPGAIPLDTDSLSIQRNVMTALGYLAQATFGTGTVVDGLVCAPTAPATMAVTVGPGSIFTLSTIDASAFGSLSSDNTDPLVKVGVNSAGSTSFTLTAPTTSGQSINYLIEAALLESDTTPIVLPYYNSASPAQPYTGPANSGVAQNTVRAQRVQLQLKAGAPATTGTQTTPAVDSGYVGLYVIIVNFGAATVTAGAISTLATAPFIPAKLGPGMNAGFSHAQVFTSSGTFTVPAGVTKCDVEIWAGGGGGGGGSAGSPYGGGGGGGGYARVLAAVTPGAAVTVTVGAGGTGGTSAGTNGGGGGTSSFGAFASATGGGGGPGSGTGSATSGGTGSGGYINSIGIVGSLALPLSGGGVIGGFGGSAFGTVSQTLNFNSVGSPGWVVGQAGNGACANAAGGIGAAGMVVVRW